MNKKEIIIFCFFFTSFIFIIMFPLKKEYIVSSKLKSINNIGIVKKNDVILQKFESTKNYSDFGLRFANYQKYIKDGYLKITIVNKKNNNKKIIKKKLSDLSDNGIFYLNYKIHKNTKYIIKIENYSDSIVTLYTTKDNDEKTKLYFNNIIKSSDLIVFYKCYKKDYSLLWYYFVLLNLFLLNYIMNERVTR